MPKASKRRGKHKTSSYSKSISGISSHKICLVTAIDEQDNILFKIGGLREESKPMFNQFKDRFKKNSLIISDAKASIIGFAMTNGMRSDSIQPVYGKNTYTTPLGNSLSSVNELHTEAKTLIRNKRGVSTRHLQEYLDWIVFRKHLKYTYEIQNRKNEAYAETMMEKIPFICSEITKLEMPVDLYKAYGSYHYGISASIN